MRCDLRAHVASRCNNFAMHAFVFLVALSTLKSRCEPGPNPPCPPSPLPSSPISGYRESTSATSFPPLWTGKFPGFSYIAGPLGHKINRPSAYLFSAEFPRETIPSPRNASQQIHATCAEMRRSMHSALLEARIRNIAAPCVASQSKLAKKNETRREIGLLQ